MQCDWTGNGSKFKIKKNAKNLKNSLKLKKNVRKKKLCYVGQRLKLCGQIFR